jgi:hypothetical protein
LAKPAARKNDEAGLYNPLRSADAADGLAKPARRVAEGDADATNEVNLL